MSTKQRMLVLQQFTVIQCTNGLAPASTLAIIDLTKIQ